MAHSNGMTTPEYVYITYCLLATPAIYEPWGPTKGLSASAIEQAQAPFARLKVVLYLIYLVIQLNLPW